MDHQKDSCHFTILVHCFKTVQRLMHYNHHCDVHVTDLDSSKRITFSETSNNTDGLMTISLLTWIRRHHLNILLQIYLHICTVPRPKQYLFILSQPHDVRKLMMLMEHLGFHLDSALLDYKPPLQQWLFKQFMTLEHLDILRH
jgi:hypothetical protein